MSLVAVNGQILRVGMRFFSFILVTTLTVESKEHLSLKYPFRQDSVLCFPVLVLPEFLHGLFRAVSPPTVRSTTVTAAFGFNPRNRRIDPHHCLRSRRGASQPAGLVPRSHQYRQRRRHRNDGALPCPPSLSCPREEVGSYDDELENHIHETSGRRRGDHQSPRDPSLYPSRYGCLPAGCALRCGVFSGYVSLAGY
jgi:hypothetical protein